MSRRRLLRLAVLAGLTVALCFGSESMVRIVRISFLARSVRTDLPPHRWGVALLNAPVREGERIRTGPDGQAEVQLECGSALRLTPNSELSVERLRLRSDGVRDTDLKIDAGTLYLSLRAGDTGDLRIEIPGAVIRPADGSARLRLSAPVGVADAPEATIEVMDGRVDVVAGKSQTWLQKPTELAIAANGMAKTVADSPPDQWSRWSHMRDLAFDRALVSTHPPPPPATTPVATMPASDATPPVPNIDDPSIFNAMDAHVGATGDPFLTAAALRKVPACGGN